MPAGRPPTYTPELIEKAHQYVASGWNVDAYDKIPSHIGLAKYIGINRLTLYRWAKEEDKEELSDILDDCMSEQQRILVGGGLSGDLNSNIVKLVLGKHGFSEKTATELTGAGGGPIETKWTVEIIDKKGKE